jgi:hypothetical protein
MVGHGSEKKTAAKAGFRSEIFRSDDRELQIILHHEVRYRDIATCSDLRPDYGPTLTLEEDACQVLFLTDGATSGAGDGGLADFERCAVLFDGNDEAALAAARAQWAGLKDAGHDLTYWQQSDQGRWEKRD